MSTEGLFQAIENQNYVEARDQLFGQWWNLWLYRADPNATYCFGTALEESVFKGNRAICKLLIDAKADPNKTLYGFTALHQAALEGKNAIVRLLLFAKADPNKNDGKHGTPLHSAARKGNEVIFRILIAAKADSGAKSKDGQTVLSAAARGGNVAICQYLLAAQIDPNASRKNGEISLHVAAEAGRSDVVFRLLLEAKADPMAKVTKRRVLTINFGGVGRSIENLEAWTVFDCAKKGGNVRICHLALEAMGQDIKDRRFFKQEGKKGSSSNSACVPSLSVLPVLKAYVPQKRSAAGKKEGDLEKREVEQKHLIQIAHDPLGRIPPAEMPHLIQAEKEGEWDPGEELEPGDGALAVANVPLDERKEAKLGEKQ
jgi:hypothetical protein